MKHLILLFLICCICQGYAQQSPTVLIVYHSESGKTSLMADAVARGVLEINGVKVIKKTTKEVSSEDLLRTDAIILGSPVQNAQPAAEVLAFIRSWPFEGSPLKDKIGAVFVTGGGISGGEELVQTSLLHSMLVFGMVVMGGEDWTAAFGASAVTGEGAYQDRVEPIFLRKAEGLGRRVAKSVIRWQGFKK